jgi:diguanylate cyclase (GGDEF)-like protein
VAERLRQRVASEIYYFEENAVSCTVSLGVAAFSGATEDIDSLMKRADNELYRAKNSGRNRVCKSE